VVRFARGHAGIKTIVTEKYFGSIILVRTKLEGIALPASFGEITLNSLLDS